MTTSRCRLPSSVAKSETVEWNEKNSQSIKYWNLVPLTLPLSSHVTMAGLLTLCLPGSNFKQEVLGLELHAFAGPSGSVLKTVSKSGFP